MRPPAPLQGIRILAIEQFGAGPWSSMLLADLGAEVIKIENPLSRGDIARQVASEIEGDDSVYFQSFNRNKKSITLNLNHPEAPAVLHPLVGRSDCVFNNLRGDLPARMGLDYPSLSRVKRSIVCASLSAFGRSGQRAAEPGYDYLMQGYAGWMSLTGDPQGPPQKAGLSLVDLGAGALAALGLVSAVMRARDTGVGCDVDVSLFDTALSQLGYVGAWHLTNGYQPQRTPDSSHPTQVPSQLLPTRDGWLVVMCAKEKFYRNLVRILGVPELAQDPRFDTFARRLKHREELAPLLKARTPDPHHCRVAALAEGPGALCAGQLGGGGPARPASAGGQHDRRDRPSGTGRGAPGRRRHQDQRPRPGPPPRPRTGGAHRPDPEGHPRDDAGPDPPAPGEGRPLTARVRPPAPKAAGAAREARIRECLC